MRLFLPTQETYRYFAEILLEASHVREFFTC